MNHFKEINAILPLEILLRIFSYLSLTELIELSKVNSYYMQIAKIIYIEKVIKKKLIVEINLGTKQSINIRYECTRFNREKEQTVWKPQAIISTENQRSVNTKEKVILRKIYFEKEPPISENCNLIHEVNGEMLIKDSGIECIKGEESLIKLYMRNKNIMMNNQRSKNLIKKHKKQKKENIINKNHDNNSLQKDEMIKTELSTVISRNSICSECTITSSDLEINDGYMLNDNCLFFYENQALIKDTIKWSFEYEVNTITNPSGDSYQKLKPSKLRLPIDLFFQNKLEEVSITKKHNYSKYKSVLKKNWLIFLEKISNSLTGIA